MSSRNDRGSRAYALVFLSLAAIVAVISTALIDAPPAVAYQHYRVPRSRPIQWLVIVLLTGNAVLLAALARGRLLAVAEWVRRKIGLGRLSALGIACLAVSAAPSRQPATFAAEALVALGLGLLVCLNLGLGLHALPPARLGGLSRALLGDTEAAPRTGSEPWSWIVAACVVLVAASLNWITYERHPHVPDEVAYLLHARYLSLGMLTMPPPPVPAAFAIDLMQYEPSRWYSPVPPGWPAVLALGVKAGVPWLINPLLGGAATILGYRLFLTMYDRRTARLATLLFASSPWMLFLSMSFMTHQLALVLALAAILGVARARASGSSWSAFAGGLATGAVSLVRPLEGLAVAALAGLWSLGARGRRFRFAPSAALVAGSVLVGAAVLPYNALLTGSARTFPIMAYTDTHFAPGANAMGFGANRGLGWSGLDPFPGHGWRDVVVNALLNGAQVNVELLGWPFSAALVVGLLFALRSSRVTRADWYNVAAIVVVVGLHAFYWFSGGPDFGARYWYLLIVPGVALAARAILSLDGALDEGRETRVAESWPTAGALVLVAFALLVYVPWRAAGKYHHYRGMRADVRALAAEHRFGDALVLVRGRRFPDYASAAVYNPVDLRGPSTIYAWDATPALRSQLLEAYAGRRVWILDGPSLTGRGFEVAAGPLTTAEARATSVPPDAAGDEAGATDPTVREPEGGRP